MTEIFKVVPRRDKCFNMIAEYLLIILHLLCLRLLFPCSPFRRQVASARSGMLSCPSTSYSFLQGLLFFFARKLVHMLYREILYEHVMVLQWN